MELPKITWHILEDIDYVQDTDYYLGSFNAESNIALDIQVWNNRYGNKTVQSIDNARLSIYFENIEDSVLLNYCHISVSNDSFSKPDIEIGKATFAIGKLHGDANNGIANEVNRVSYKNVRIEFRDLPYNLKSGLKNMFLDIEID